MTLLKDLNDHFEKAFEVYEKYRMYPPNHERETMIIIKDRHIAAIARAESFMSQGITNCMSERHQKHVRGDIEALKEVRVALRLMMNEPVLPFALDPGTSSKKVGNDGYADALPTS